jgi:hypothetical protein
MKAIAPAAATLLAISLVGVHVYAVRRGAELTGVLLFLDHLFVIGLAGGLLFLCTAVGRVAIRRIDIEDDSAIDTLAFSMATGVGLLSTTVLLVSAVIGVRRSILTLIVLAAAGVGWRQTTLLPALVLNAMRELREKAGIAALVISGIGAVVMVVLAIAPPADYDSLMYHLRIPAQFLGRGVVYVPEDNLHVAFVGLAHFAYLPLLAADAPASVALLSTCFAFVLCAVLLTAGVRFFSAQTGRLAMMLFWGSPVVLLVAVTPKVDVTLTCYVFLGHYALLRAIHSGREPTPWFVLAAALLGFASGVKYLALAYVAALAPLVLACVFSWDRPNVKRLRLLARFGFVFAGAALPWLVKNVVLVGAPLYPFFSETVLPPWLEAFHVTARPPSTLDSGALKPLRAVREPFNLLTWFVAPEQLTPEGEGSLYGANPVFLVLPFALLLIRNRMFAALFLPGVLFVGIVLLRGLHINLRYLTPALPILTLATACIVAAAIGKAGRYIRSGVVVGAVLAFSLLPTVFAVGQKLRDTRAPAHALGALSRARYWSDSPYAEIASYARMTTFVNSRLSPDARILLLFEGRGYGYKPHVLQDNVLTNWPLLISGLGPSRCLDSSGITNVLVNTEVWRYFIDRGLNPRLILWDRFEDFAKRCLVLIERRPGFELYGVRSAKEEARLGVPK